MSYSVSKSFYLISLTLFFLNCNTIIAKNSPTTSSKKQQKKDSRVIVGIQWDFNSHKRMAVGSDNWPMTWADDDNQYTAWGDGWGFKQSGAKTSLGVSKISGTFNSYAGNDLWKGYGKSYGIISIKGILYMWVSPGSNIEGFKEARLYFSSDHGRSWTKSQWAFSNKNKNRFVIPTFLQFGKNNSLAIDKYTYVYAVNLKDKRSLKMQKPGELTLMRVLSSSVTNRNAYEFFAGSDKTGPRWTKNIDARKPVLKTSRGVGWTTSAIYYPPIKRFLIITEHTQSFKGNMAVYESPTPWGPWYEVASYSNFGGYKTTFFWNIAPKWINGYNFTLVFTGTGAADSWNTVNGKLIVNTSAVKKTD